MITANSKIHDELIKHQVYLLRLVKGQQKQFKPILTKANRQIISLINEYVSKLTSRTTQTNRSNWNVLQRKIYTIRKNAINDYLKKYDPELDDIIYNEAEYLNSLIVESVPISISLNKPKEEDISNLGVFSGRTKEQWFTSLLNSDVTAIMTAIQYGVYNDLDRRNMIARIKHKMNITFNNADNIVQTISLGVAEQSRSRIALQNTPLLPAEIYTAVLDSKTTPICRSLDDNIYPIGIGPIPPVHANCRSMRIPIINIMGLIGKKRKIVLKNGEEIKFWDMAKIIHSDTWSNLNNKDKAKLVDRVREDWFNKYIGKTPKSTPYSDWLLNQDEEFQNSVLGITRAKLFRSNKLSDPLGKFIDHSGEQYTINELYSKYPQLKKIA